MKTQTGHKAHVSKKKIQSVKELTKLIGENRTVLIASIKNIPASQFQEISKKLRGKAVIKVPKRNLIGRVLDTGDEHLKKLNGKVDDSTAIIFSDLDPFELAMELMQSKSPVRAKAGQIAPMDIEIPAGPTELMPGPAITELGALGIQIMIDKGKISIKEAKIIAKKDEGISKNAVEVLNKLDIKPFKVGFIPIAAFDIHAKKLYLEIKIDKEETLANLKNQFGKALAFAVSINYTSKDTIKFLLGKALSHEKAIENLMANAEETKSGETE
ncbi:MAG TPA: 50S ribosomal protein L10 [Candidatus Omnitrophota bacterium]|nr:50S ribosomal protein L10 [Candidatus Omnitrophota bacterium]